MARPPTSLPSLSLALRVLVAVAALSSAPAWASIPRASNAAAVEPRRDDAFLEKLADELVSATEVQSEDDGFVVREIPLSAAEPSAPEKPHPGIGEFLADAHRVLDVCNALTALEMEAYRSGSRSGNTFSGHYFDREANLYSTPSRYYDPETGRFISQDGIEYGHVDDPPSLHLYYYAYGNPLRYVDPSGHDTLRQLWDLDTEKKSAWHYMKAAAYQGLNIISLGTTARQDRIIQQFDRGEISRAEYWGKTGINAGTSFAILGATAPTGGYAGGLAQGAGYGTLVQGAAGGFASGVTGQAISDVSEVAALRTKDLADVSGKDYLAAGGFGALGGGIVGGLAGRGVNVNPDVPGLGWADVFPGQVTRPLAGAMTSVTGVAYGAGQRHGAMVAAEASDLIDAVFTRAVGAIEPYGARAAPLPENLSLPTANDMTLADKAILARDRMVAALQDQPSKVRNAVTTVAASVEPSGDVNVRAKVSRSCPGCVEDMLHGAATDASAMKITPAVRPRTGEVVPVCTVCEPKFGRSTFLPGTPFRSDLLFRQGFPGVAPYGVGARPEDTR